MGRGTRDTVSAYASLGPSVNLRHSALEHSDLTFLIGRLKRRGQLGHLPHHEQRHMVELIQKAAVSDDPRSQALAQQGREVLVDSNSGAIRGFLRDHAGVPVEDDSAFQAARIGMLRAIDSYDPAEGASFLYYAQYQMHNELSEAAQWESPGVRLKAKAHRMGVALTQHLKDVENNGLPQPTVEELTSYLQDRYASLSVSEDQVLAILPHLKPMLSLDAPAGSDAAGSAKYETYASVINGEERVRLRKRAGQTGSSYRYVVSDTSSEQERAVISAEARQAVHAALDAKVNDPLARRVFEMTYGMGREEVPQKAMFDGVYLDSEGVAYSAESALIKEKGDQGIEVQLASQRVLNERISNGELVFSANSPEAEELYKLTGIPPTSGTIQYMLKTSQAAIAASVPDQREDIVYRGANVLENSALARETARRRLMHQQRMSKEQADKLKTSRPGRDGSVKTKGPLRKQAESSGIVDAEGRLLDESPIPSARRKGDKRPLPLTQSGPISTRRLSQAELRERRDKRKSLQGQADLQVRVVAPRTPEQAAAVKTARDRTMTLHCANGDHSWDHTPTARSSYRPKSCPMHRAGVAVKTSSEFTAARKSNPAIEPAITGGSQEAALKTAPATMPKAKAPEAAKVSSTGTPSSEQLAPTAPAKAQSKSKAAPVKAAPTTAPTMRTLHCEAGNHEWQRLAQRGRLPKSCPQHVKPIKAVSDERLTQLNLQRAAAQEARRKAQEAFHAAAQAKRVLAQAQADLELREREAALAARIERDTQIVAQQAEREAGINATKTAWCVKGGHAWERATGSTASNCPEHR